MPSFVFFCLCIVKIFYRVSYDLFILLYFVSIDNSKACEHFTQKRNIHDKM